MIGEAAFGARRGELALNENAYVTGHYEFRLQAQGAGRVTCIADHKVEDIRSYANLVRTSVPHDCRKDGKEYLKIGKAQRGSFLGEVERSGTDLYEALVPSHTRPKFEELLQAFPGADIRVNGQAAEVPWEALFIPGLNNGSFLGSHHTVIRDTHTFNGIRKPSSSGRAGYIEDDRLPAVAAGRAEDVVTAFGSFDKLRPVKTTADQEAIPQFFLPETHKYHLDCHVEGGPNRSLPEASIRISSSYLIRYVDMKEKLLPITGAPFVFLNLCAGGTVGLASDLSFARKFLELGATEVIATENDIGDDFAVEFAATFYLAARDFPVGVALRLARLAFIHHDHNPMALFYSLYASGQTVLDLKDPGAGEIFVRAATRLAAGRILLGL